MICRILGAMVIRQSLNPFLIYKVSEQDFSLLTPISKLQQSKARHLAIFSASIEVDIILEEKG